MEKAVRAEEKSLWICRNEVHRANDCKYDLSKTLLVLKTALRQLSVYPDLKDYKYPPGGHKIVHFGCCQDPAIYWLQPILWSPKYLSFNHFVSLPTKTEKEARNNSNS